MTVASRVVVCAALCAAVCASLAACPKGDVARPLDRPAPPTTGLADARVLFVDGNVEVTPPSGAPFAAKVGTDLVADDRIGAATSSKIVVVLRNGHAVRIDDAGALKVRDIVLFQAPETERPVDEQLRELLDEGEALPLAEVRDRAAAWRQMLRAAETGGAESREDAMNEASKARAESAKASAKEEASAVGAAAESVAMAPPLAQALPPPPAEPVPDSAPESDDDRGAGLGLQGVGPGGGGSNLGGVDIGSIGKRGGGSGSGYGSGAGGLGSAENNEAQKQKVALDESDERVANKDAPPARMRGDEGKMGKKNAPAAPAVAVAPAAAAPAAVPAGFVVRFGASAGEAQPVDVTPALAVMASELGKCIGRALPASVTLSTTDLLVEVRDGKVKRVRLSGALPVPLCARNVAVERAAIEIASTRGGGGWLVVTVPLSR